MATLDRRTFVKGLGVAAGALLSRTAAAQETYRIGLVVPGGARLEVGERIAFGVRLGLDEANVMAGLFGKRLELLQEVADGAEAVLSVGRRLVRQERAIGLVGGADEASAEALRDAAQQGDALFLNVGASASRLRGSRCHRHAFHVEASLAMYVGAVQQWLLEQRKLTRWALVTSDSSLGRDIGQVATAFLARRGRAPLATEQVPGGTQDWNPLLKRLGGLGPDAVFVGLEESDLPIFLRGYRSAGLTFQLAGAGVDPSALSAGDPADLAGVWPVLWHHELQRFSARELNSRFRRRFGRPLEGRSWAAWAAVKLLGEAIVRTGSGDLAGLLRFLESAPPFDGHKGRPLTFRDWDHQLRQPMYLVTPRKPEPGREPWKGFEVVAEVPARGDLDAIGEPKGESRCRFDG
ncbi:MAG: ABC transporter substrate-binding protein [Candidatus Rokubacteria bacterium]|nr:ABC transporter substrate-binding protein [Candidatus Rokubacteria bacterium]